MMEDDDGEGGIQIAVAAAPNTGEGKRARG